MLQMKKKFKQFICYMLVLAVVLSTVPFTKASASEGDSHLQEISEKVAEVVGEQKEYAEEAEQDAKSKYSAGDWFTACINPKGDNLPWNYFHNAVQKHIRKMVADIAKREIEIKLKSGKKGRADLYKDKNSKRYIWEVKPLSYKSGKNKEKGEKQLKRYVEGTSEGNFAHDYGYNSGVTIPNGKFTKGKYEIKYEDAGNGLILYNFKRKSEPTPTPGVEEPRTPIQKPSSKDDAKDDLGDRTGSGITDSIGEEEGDTDIAAIVAAATITIGVASGIAIAHKYLQNTISVSSTLYTQSVRIATIMTAFLANPTQAYAAEVQSEIDDYITLLEVLLGKDIAVVYRDALESGDQDKIDEILKYIQEKAGDYEKAGEAQPPRDPLILDLGIEGIELKSLENGVNFDLDNNSFAEKTAWIGTEDGFLALDRNNNGKIDNGGELFGDQVTMKDGSKSASGFEALKELDDNEDGVINCKDVAFGNLLVWIDANHNGKSESGELKSLNEIGVKSTSLDYKKVSLVDDETGSRIAETADVIIKKGDAVTTTQISEFWFPVNASDTTQGDTVTAGNVPDILTAIENDKSGELNDLCMQFASLNDVASKRYYLKKILYYITDAEDIPAGSRGGNIDARDLKVIEQFMGRDFVGVGGSNPNSNAANILKEIYIDIENQYYNLLNIYAAFGIYVKTIYEYEDENGEKALELAYLYYILDSKIDDRDDVDTLLYDFGVYLSSFDIKHGTNYFEDFKEHYAPISTHYSDILEFSEKGFTYLGTGNGDSHGGTVWNDFIFGLEGSDILSGAGGNDSIIGNEGDDALSGGAGNDDLSGKEGNDTLDGGAGDDILKGGRDDDIYIFAKGYGNDTVIDIDGLNTLRFKGLSTKDILVNGIDGNDVIVKIKGTSDTLILSDFGKDDNYHNYNLEFEDASMYITDTNSPFHYIYGDDGDDILKAVIEESYLYGYKGDDTITGSEGNDIIYGNQDDDSIYAGKGDDKIFAGSGDDVLDGGVGNDYLYGGKGNDTYVFSKSYGTDVICDVDGKSMIEFVGDISLTELEIYLVGENAVIRIKDTDDKIIVNGYLENSEQYLLRLDSKTVMVKEYIADGSEIFWSGSDNSDYILNDSREVVAGGKANDRILGTDGGEYVFGDSGDDQLLTSDGDDIIFAGTGKDYVNGGAGNDFIDAGAGNDFVDGGAGDDVYIFCKGYGQDSVMDSDGANMIMFGDGLKAESIKAYRHNWNDILITFDEMEDTVIIKNYCISEKARNFILVFADGTVVSATAQNSPLRTIYGTDGSEYMPSIYTDGITKVGQDGDDQLVGSDGNDFLYGGKGNDRITGNGGNDVLDGGEGNDYLYGGEGDDTYIFKQGYDTDTISDGSGVNTIEIYGYTRNQIKAYRTNWNNITIIFDESKDKLVIEGFFSSEANRNFYLVFNGGSKVHATASGSPLRTIYGTDESEYIVAMDDRGVTIFGEYGSDNLNGGNGADKLFGGAGDDRLNGNAENDTLDGGQGNDYLCGGAGNDTYIFNNGYGTDTIIDSEGINTISLGDGLSVDKLTAYRINWNDLAITFEDIDEKVVINGYFTSEGSRKFNVHFADGTKFAYDDADNPIKQVHATEYDDWMSAWSDEGIVIYGDNGNDHLTGGKGDDILSGGKGDDYLNGKEGDDTYLFGSGYGSDIIEDNDGQNTVQFENLTLDMVAFEINKNGTLVVSKNGEDDTLIIKDFDADLFVFEFANGKTGIIDVDTDELTKIKAE